jgi:hypothetical protein
VLNGVGLFGDAVTKSFRRPTCETRKPPPAIPLYLWRSEMKPTAILVAGLASAFIGLTGCSAMTDNPTSNTGGSTGGTATSGTSTATSGGSTGGSSTTGTSSGTSGTTGCTPTPPWEGATADDSAEAAAVQQPADDEVDPKCLAACDAALAACLAPCKAAFNRLFITAQQAWFACVLTNPVLQCTTGICTIIYNANIAAITAQRTACQSPCWTALNNCQTACGVKNNN